MAPMAVALEAALKAAGAKQAGSSGPVYSWAAVSETGVQLWLSSSLCDHPLREVIGNGAIFVAEGEHASAPRQDEEACVLARRIVTAGPTLDRRAILLSSQSSSAQDKALPHIIVGPTLVPMRGDTARAIVSTYVNATAQFPTTHLPGIVALYEAAEGQLAYIGAVQTKVPATPEDLARNRVTVREGEKYAVATVTNFEVTQTPQRIPASPAELKQLVALHVDGDRMAIDADVSTRFDIVGCHYPKVDLPIGSSVSLLASWVAQDLNVFGTPPASASTTLVARCLPFDEDPHTNPLAKALSSEFAFLRLLFSVRENPSKWATDAPALSLHMSLEELLKDEVAEITDPEPEAWTAASLPARKDLDFTERLWRFCLAAQGHEDLADILAKVFAALEKGVILPFVHKNNRSALAAAVRDVVKVARLTSRDAVQQKEAVAAQMDALTANAIDTLLGVGLFKLRRDYRHYLGGVGVFEGAYFDDENLPLETQVARQWELHRIFELWAFLKHNVPSLSGDAERAVMSIVGARAAEGGIDRDQPIEVAVALPRFTGTTTTTVAALTRNQEPAVVSILFADEVTSGRVQLLRLARGNDPIFATETPQDADDADIEDVSASASFAVAVGRRSVQSWIE